MFRLLLFTLLPFSCPGTNYSNWSPTLHYEIRVEPTRNVLEITGSLQNIRPGNYFFILPRTQGAPVRHFVSSIEFSDEQGPLTYSITEQNEWKVKSRGRVITFNYAINLNQSSKYAREAWGGCYQCHDRRHGFFLMVALASSPHSFVALLLLFNLAGRSHPRGKSRLPWTTGQLETPVASQYALVRNYYAVYRDGSMYTRRINSMDLNVIWLVLTILTPIPQAKRAINKVVEAALSIFGYEASRESITLILRDTNLLNQFRASTEANSIEFNFKEGTTFDQLWGTYREGFLRLLAHEIMHTWDRRKNDQATAYMHVPEWGPDTCWIREGFTEYFAMLNLFNAEIYDRTQF